ncbi:MAG: hypothetical protein KDE00_09195 [Rhodobacteraceae bacterium]|nr:hypothetical protein [Paracoccaceae bacterium]
MPDFGFPYDFPRDRLPFPFDPPFKIKWSSISSVEVTQAIQYNRASQHLTDPSDRGPDNSVPLVCNKTTWVRVYVSSLFLRGARFRGRIRVERQTSWFEPFLPALTILPQAPGVVTAAADSYDTERSTLGASLNFIIPAAQVRGRMKITAEIWHDGQDEANIVDDHVVDVAADLRQTLSLRGVMIAYNGPNAAGTANLNLPAPTVNDLMTTAATTLTRMPVEAQGNFSSAGTINWATPLTGVALSPGGCSQQWLDLNAAIAAVRTLDGNRTDVIYYGLLPSGIPIANVGGCASSGVTSGGIGAQVTMAHEVGHACGLPHAPCGTPGDATYPAYEPYDAANTPNASLGEYALDTNNGAIQRPNAKDLMSYCGGNGFSLHNYNRLYNNSRLDPRSCRRRFRIPELVDPYLWPWEYIPDPQPEWMETWRRQITEPLVSVIAVVQPDDRVEVKSVMRLMTSARLDGASVSDRIRVQLIGEGGEVVAEAPAQMFASQGCGGGCGCSGDCGCGCEGGGKGRRSAMLVQAFLPDREPGSELRIVVSGEDGEEPRVIWSRRASGRRVKLGGFEVSVEGDKGRARWSVEAGEGEPPLFALQFSKDKGRSWNALVSLTTGDGAEFDAAPLPHGSLIFRLTAHDGFHSESVTSKSVRVQERPPLVAILHPRPGAEVAAGIPMKLWAAVNLRTGEQIDPDACQWSLDGTDVGNGIEAYVAAPEEGRHKLRLRVKGEGGEAVAETTFETYSGRSDGLR